jgi:hypothetical protein
MFAVSGLGGQHIAGGGPDGTGAFEQPCESAFDDIDVSGGPMCFEGMGLLLFCFTCPRSAALIGL